MLNNINHAQNKDTTMSDATCSNMKGMMSKHLAPLSSIRTRTGLMHFKGSRSEIYFQEGLFVKNVF
jgi:hypothetical protein